ncbi:MULTISPECIES: hypothetical protein [Rummeliibacillus]|uniref:hypothetical protein n=1 Tax=Rummeliibacillus TaxID=648802 RepID=UPI0011B628FC|nr:MULTISPECIES: hypothetical protein [Rummeliibacillus]MBO2535982.1 hypothetical protein [Rummeliibacillus suwonensis]
MIIRVFLEFFRVLILLFLLMAIISYPIRKLYDLIGIGTDNYFYITEFAIFLLVYVIYNNKLQFTGFYTEGAKKLPSKVTWSIVSISILLLSIPIIMNGFK